MPDPSLIIAAASDLPVPLRGAALLGLVLLGGAAGVVAILTIAWMRRRRTAVRGRTAARAATAATDPWRESARRVRVDADSNDDGSAGGSQDARS